MSNSLIPSFLMCDLLSSLTKNERIARFLSKSLIRSFFRKKWAIRSENQWANSQPWHLVLQAAVSGDFYHFNFSMILPLLVFYDSTSIKLLILTF